MIDVEEELCRILQEEIWKEIEAETGQTKTQLDAEIIEKIISIHKSGQIESEWEGRSLTRRDE